MGFIALQFNNCGGGPQTSNLFDGSSLCPEGNCTYTENGQSQSLRINNDSLQVRCEDDNIHVSGNCNPGDVYDNQIKYYFTRVVGTNTYTMKFMYPPPYVKCEYGKFNFVLPVPHDPVSTDCTLGYCEYQLVLQLYTQATQTSAMTAGPKYSITSKFEYRPTSAAEAAASLTTPCPAPPHAGSGY